MGLGLCDVHTHLINVERTSDDEVRSREESARSTSFDENRLGKGIATREVFAILLTDNIGC